MKMNIEICSWLIGVPAFQNHLGSFELVKVFIYRKKYVERCYYVTNVIDANFKKLNRSQNSWLIIIQYFYFHIRKKRRWPKAEYFLKRPMF